MELAAAYDGIFIICRSQDGIVNGWLFFRYLTVGLYVGCSTVTGFAWWFLSYSVSFRLPTWLLKSNAMQAGLNTSNA